jgi:hypothetical protein
MDALFYHESIVTPISSFVFLLNYFALYLSQYNETFEFHQSITTCDSQIDHMWLSKVTSIKNNCDKFVNQNHYKFIRHSKNNNS